MTNLGAAIEYLESGLSVIPVDVQTKKPFVKWEPYQKHLATKEEAAKFWSNGQGIACIGGKVSGNLEFIDFDEPGISTAWLKVLKSWGRFDLVTKLVIEKTQRAGGAHAGYRHEGKPEGNLKLASKENGEVRIETRGEGGYCIIAPTKGYALTQGFWTKLPVLTAEERETLLSAARSLDLCPSKRIDPAGSSVGDDYNQRASIDEILIPLGWTRAGSKGEVQFWVRPGKDKKDGHSATWNFGGRRTLHVFSSSAGIECGDYDLFGLYARLNHHGDFKEAAKSLGKSGYGKSPERAVKEHVQPRQEQRWQFASSIEVQKVDWLFEPYIPCGEITFLAGDPGVGKSTLAQAIASVVTIGGQINGMRLPEGRVIFLSAEQSPSQITVPRFIQMEADLSKILMPDDESAEGDIQPFVLDQDGIEELRDQAFALHPKLIVVDTVTAYFEAARDFNSANQVREWMRRLLAIARSTGCAMLVTGHTNKNTQTKALYRVSGSIDFTGASRSVLMCGMDPDDHKIRAADHIKSNVGPLGSPIGFTTEDGIFGFTGHSDLTADRMMEMASTRETRSKREACKEWLLNRLKDGAVNAKTIEEDWKKAGWGRNMVLDLKKELGITSERDKFGENGEWVWLAPVQAEAWWAK